MTDPHANDFCVVCKRSPECGETMYPVAPIDNGCVCGKCIIAGSSKLSWGIDND